MSYNKQRDQLIELAKRVDYADIAFETFFELKFGSSDWNTVYHLGNYDQGGAFWAVTRKALFENSLLYVCEIYKRLVYFLNDSNFIICLYEDTNYLGKKSIQQCKDEVGIYKPKFENLKKIRNKGLAHLDSEWIAKTDSLFQAYKLEYEDIRHMIQLERDICNCLLQFPTSVRYYNCDDVSYILTFIKNHLE